MDLSSADQLATELAGPGETPAVDFKRANYVAILATNVPPLESYRKLASGSCSGMVVGVSKGRVWVIRVTSDTTESVSIEVTSRPLDGCVVELKSTSGHGESGKFIERVWCFRWPGDDALEFEIHSKQSRGPRQFFPDDDADFAIALAAQLGWPPQSQDLEQPQAAV